MSSYPLLSGPPFSIKVYILSEISLVRANILGRSLFSDKIFETLIPDFSLLPDNIENLEKMKISQILINSSKNSPESPVIIIKDSSTSATSSESLRDVLIQVIENNKFDIFFLCRWLDKCDLTSPLMTLKDKLIKITSTHFAQGVQGILFSPEGRDKAINLLTVDDPRDTNDILLDNMARKKITAICAIPNLINFDISFAKNIINESFKTEVCEVKTGTKEISKEITIETANENFNYFWFFLIFFIIFLIYITKN